MFRFSQPVHTASSLSLSPPSSLPFLDHLHSLTSSLHSSSSYSHLHPHLRFCSQNSPVTAVIPTVTPFIFLRQSPRHFLQPPPFSIPHISTVNSPLTHKPHSI